MVVGREPRTQFNWCCINNPESTTEFLDQTIRTSTNNSYKATKKTNKPSLQKGVCQCRVFMTLWMIFLIVQCLCLVSSMPLANEFELAAGDKSMHNNIISLAWWSREFSLFLIFEPTRLPTLYLVWLNQKCPPVFSVCMKLLKQVTPRGCL